MKAARVKRHLAIAAAIVTLAGSATALAATPSTAAQTSSTTITMAEQPGQSPNYIFPIASCAHYSTANIQEFQQLMFRPLYWFGLGSSSAEVPSLSLANQPKLSTNGTSLSFVMKNWKFANGTTVSASSVRFFFNLERVAGTNFCINDPATASSLISAVSTSGSIVTVSFSTRVNLAWILNDLLADVTPLPLSWSVADSGADPACATGVYGAAATTTACTAVLSHLQTLGANSASFATSFWQGGVDGPWKLASLTSGKAHFVANGATSSPQKPLVKNFIEVPMANASAVATSLTNATVTMSAIDPFSLPQTTMGVTGSNATAWTGDFRLSSAPSNQLNDIVINRSQSTGLMAQLYLRQALAEAVNEGVVAQKLYNGYGNAEYSALPADTIAGIGTLSASSALPSSSTAAATLLSDHGWSSTNNVLTCHSSTLCGSGIAVGAQLHLAVVEVSGTGSNEAHLTSALNQVIAAWTALGMTVTRTYASLPTALSACSSGTSYQLCDLGTGWSFGNQTYPEGSAILKTGAMGNSGGLDDTVMNQAIAASLLPASTLSAYATYTNQSVPVIWQPSASVVWEFNRSLRGAKFGKVALPVAANPLGVITPEYYYY